MKSLRAPRNISLQVAGLVWQIRTIRPRIHPGEGYSGAILRSEQLLVGEGAGNVEADGLGSGIFKGLPEALPSQITNKMRS
jgi:hypothetical protein